MSKKLYIVKLRGMQLSGTGVMYGISYVVAENTDAAYDLVKEALYNEDIGFRHERELQSVELLAEQGKYPECRMRLYIQG